MITYVNNSNATKYTVLYEEATQALIEAQILYDTGKSDVDLGIEYEKDENQEAIRDFASGLYVAKDPINTIEKYFFYLPKLVELGDANSSDHYKVLHSAGRRYAMLPLDEEPFLIDANKRTITVPAGFASNGVAVQGDQLAEVLYFKIDRYFDAKDLDDADIFIQWTVGSGNNIETGLSTPLVIDIESEPNKIIFGWALSDKITANAGNIQFAVRFYQWANDAKTKLQYSWSTQTASVKVNPALDFDLSEDYLQQIAANMEDENKLLMARIKGSQTYVTDNEEAKPPVYVLNLKDNPGVAYTPAPAGDGIVYVDLARDEDLDDEVYVLKVQAKSDDSGIITYGWNFTSIDGNTTASGATVGSDADPSHSVVKVVYEKTLDKTVLDKVYYKQTTVNGVTSYKAFDTAGLADGETPQKKGLYERIATCTVNQVGKFFATATNSKAGSNSKTKDSDICIIPMPIQPTITTNLIDKASFKEEDNASVTLGIEAINEEANGTANGSLTYQWYMKNKNPKDESVGEYVRVEGATNDTLTLSFEADQDPKSVEGFYQVIVSNHKNGEVVSTTSAACRVSYVASAPIIKFPATYEDTQIDFSNADKKQNVKIELQEVWTSKWNISDDIQYQWYTTGDEIVGNGPDDTSDAIIEGANEAAFIPTEKGKYYCVVTNVKNGTEASVASRVFFVV